MSKLGLTLLAVLSISLSVQAAAIWDLNTDMNTSVNDNGIWSYGYGDTTNNYVGLLDNSTPNPSGPEIFWNHSISKDPANEPHIWKGHWAWALPLIPNDKHMGCPSGAYTSAIFRWTAPASVNAGQLMSIVGDATLLHLVDDRVGNVDITLVHNGSTVLFSHYGLSYSGTAAFDFTTAVNPGDTLDLKIGGNGNIDGALSGWTAVDFTVTEIPEPATMGLLISGVTVGLLRRKR